MTLARWLLGSSSGAGSFSAAPPPPPPPAGWPAAWLTAAMTNGVNATQLFTSSDGLTWTPYGSVLTTLATARDPSIIQLHGQWWIAVTNAASTWGLFSSPDLATWTLAADVSTGSSSSTWAPQWFIDDDGSIHVYVYCNPAGGDKYIYEMHPLNDAMTEWSDPVRVNNRWGWYDGSVIRIGDTYFMFTAGGMLLSGSSPTWMDTLLLTSQFDTREAPKIIKLADGTFRVYWVANSFYDSTGWWYYETTNPALVSGWSAGIDLHSMDGYNHPVPIRAP